MWKNPVWSLTACFGAALVAAPIVFMMFSMFQPDELGVWDHLWKTVLWDYIWGSIAITGGATAIATVLGATTAWLVVRFQFPGRKLFTWALLLPMAMPAYVLAYCWTDLLEFAGPIQTTLRELFGWSRRDYWFPDIRSIPGAIIVMGMVLYPYVYLTARAAFLEQGMAVFETARSLGWGPWRCFLRLALPLARPAIVAGASLVAMECLADYGTVDYFGVQTFTTGIYRTWSAFHSYSAATRLASMLLILVVIIVSLERFSRGQKQFHRTGTRQQQDQQIHLTGWKRWLACAYCAFPLIIGFGIPLIILSYHSVTQSTWNSFVKTLTPAWVSFQLAAIAAISAVGFALIIAYGKRLHPNRVITVASRVASMGYAIPGSVVAIAVLVPLAWVDNHIIDALFDSGLVLSGTIAGLVFAYLVRFLAVAMGSIESGLHSITPSMDRAARSLGSSPSRTLLRVHMPLMWASMGTAGLLVFVDVLKELPATVILRPLNVTTLAVQVHDQVSQESLHLAALPSLVIVLTGLLPVMLVTRSITRARNLGEQR